MNWLDFANNIENDVSGVYCIKNTVNNKTYIGISTDLKHRIKTHYHKLQNSNHHNKHLQKSVNFYNLDHFTVEVIELVEESNLLIKENFYQQLYKSTDSDYGYNVLLTDVNGQVRHSEESKRKISIGNKGKIRSKETRVKLSIANLGSPGTPHTEKHKVYMSQKMSGRTLSDETKKKMSTARMGKPGPNKGKKIGIMARDIVDRMTLKKLGALNPRAIKIRAQDGTEYGTIGEAAKALKICRSTANKLIKNGTLVRA